MSTLIERFVSDGDGYGDGYGDVSLLNGHRVYRIDGVPTILRLVQLDDEMNGFAIGSILRNDLTLSKTYVAKRGGFFAHGCSLDEAVREAEAKAFRALPEEKRIDRFIEEFPDEDMFASAARLFELHGMLTGSCRQGREHFCREHSISMEYEYTIAQFVALTIGAYGGHVISRLRDKYIELRTTRGGRRKRRVRCCM